MQRLEKLDESLWLADGGTVNFYGFPYPTRGVIVRLSDERLWVWSPIKLADDLRAEVDRAGRVAHLVSPNKLHHLHLGEWKAAYPTAELWGPQSTINRFPELGFAGALGEAPPAEWGPVFDQAWFRGSFMMDEIVFFHQPSRTAIVADLIQAFDEAFLRRQWSWWRRPMARLGGIGAANPGAPSDWRLSFLDRTPARAARAKVLGWECERVVIAHGAWVRSGGRDFLRRALAWLGPGSG
jgi:hypothetical protein